MITKYTLFLSHRVFKYRTLQYPKANTYKGYCGSGFMEFVKDERTIEEIRASILGTKSCSNCHEQVSLYANNKEKLCSKCVNPNEDSQWDKYDKSIECGFTHNESLVVFN